MGRRRSIPLLLVLFVANISLALPATAQRTDGISSAQVKAQAVPVTPNSGSPVAVPLPSSINQASSCTTLRQNLRALAQEGEDAALCVEPKNTIEKGADLRLPQGLGPSGGAPDQVFCQTLDWNVLWAFRYQGCRYNVLHVELLQVPQGTVLGTAEVVAIELIDTFKLNRHWTTKLFVNMYQATGIMLAGASINTWTLCVSSADCYKKFESPVEAQVPLVLHQPLDGIWTFASDLVSHTLNATQWINLRFSHPTSNHSASYGLGVSVRCDTEFASQGGGCVFPSFTPTFVLDSNLPEVDESAHHILVAQDELIHHPGLRGFGLPLNRLANQVLSDRNRETACEGFVPAEPGDSCDEYPFASTYQGADMAGPGRFSVASVNLNDNITTGSRLIAFYREQRVLDRDPFWVHIIE